MRLAAQHKMACATKLLRGYFGFDALTPVRHVGELALRFPLLLFVPGNLGFFFGIRIIDQRQLRFLRRAGGKGHATCQ